jgi:hypothetical protein
MDFGARRLPGAKISISTLPTRPLSPRVAVLYVKAWPYCPGGLCENRYTKYGGNIDIILSTSDSDLKTQHDNYNRYTLLMISRQRPVEHVMTLLTTPTAL